MNVRRDGDRWYRETPRSAALASAVAVVGSLLLGGLTSLAQGVLPEWLNSLSNSAGGWTMLAFLLVWLGRARPLLAAVLGIVAFEGLIEGYAAVSAWRGHFYAAPFSGIFSLVGLVAGPVLGVAASLTRYGTLPWRVLAVTPLSAVLIGEGVWALMRVADTTSPVYWVLEIVAGAAFLAAAVARRRPGWRWSLVAAGVALVGAAVFFIGYDLLGGVR